MSHLLLLPGRLSLSHNLRISSWLAADQNTLYLKESKPKIEAGAAGVNDNRFHESLIYYRDEREAKRLQSRQPVSSRIWETEGKETLTASSRSFRVVLLVVVKMRAKKS